MASVLADGTTALTPAPPARSRSRILRIGTAALAIATLLAGLYLLMSDRAPPAAGAKAAIAILPLRTESNDPTPDYFAEGLTQDIISAMGRFPELA